MKPDSATISRIAGLLTSRFQGRQDAYAIRSSQADSKGTAITQRVYRRKPVRVQPLIRPKKT